MHSFWLVSTLGGLIGGLDGGRVGSLVGPVVHLFPFPDIDVVGRRCRVALTYYLYRMQGPVPFLLARAPRFGVVFRTTPKSKLLLVLGKELDLHDSTSTTYS
jgi:hypothetical protein